MSFCPQKIEKATSKSCILMAVRSFFSAASTAQSSPELHFRFINHFIQLSLLGSLHKSKVEISQNFVAFSEYMNFTYISV